VDRAIPFWVGHRRLCDVTRSGFASVGRKKDRDEVSRAAMGCSWVWSSPVRNA